MNPARRAFAALIRAMSPAHKGATALVPPMTVFWPSTRTSYPVCGSASPQTSGTPRIVSACVVPDDFLACSPSWYGGNAKKLLTPPPVAPLLGPLFHTVSCVMVVPEARRLVPPQARQN